MRLLPFIIFILFFIGIETYAFIGLRTSLFSDNRKVFFYIFLITTILTIIGILLLINTVSTELSRLKTHENILFGLAFSFILIKFLMSTVFLVEDLFRSFQWIFQSTINFKLVEITSRSYLAGFLALTIGSILFLLLNYGVLFGRYQFTTHRQVLTFENLPSAFDGFKIAQISDLHLGTFDQIERTRKGLQKLQSENADVILFTGDMVNNRAEEALPFINMFKELTAPFGKFSVLGNHDYGEYVR